MHRTDRGTRQMVVVPTLPTTTHTADQLGGPPATPNIGWSITIGTSQMPVTERLQSVKAKPPFETVVRHHGPTVFRVCSAVVGALDADDAWSETFLAALKAYPELPLDANLEAWLVTIAHHKAIDIARTRTRRPIPTDVVPEPSRPGATHDFDDLAAAVDGLPPKQKHAVAYHYLAGLPYNDIAEILGGTAAAARRAASDGIATLRRTYRGELVEVPALLQNTGRSPR